MAFSLLASGSAQPLNTFSNMQLLRGLGIFGYWTERDGGSGVGRDGVRYTDIITEFIYISGPSSWGRNGDCIPGRPCPQPAPTPPHMQKPNKDQDKNIRDALNRVQDLLKNSECNQAISSSFYNANEILSSVSIKGMPGLNSGYNAYVFTPRTSLTNGEIELHAPFFTNELSSTVGNSNSIDLGLAIFDRRVLLILHELAHVTRKYTHPHASRAVNQLKSVAVDEIADVSVVNKRIYDACLKGLEGKAGGTVAL